MIRLAISGVEGPALQAIAGRLRGAALDPPGDRDAAVVLSDSPESLATAELFLRAGKSVLLTAESCSSVETLDRLAAASGGRRTLAVLNGERYLPSRRLVKEQLDAGNFGAAGLVRIHRWIASEIEDGRGTSRPWLLDLDLAAWLVGAMPEKIYAASSENALCIQIHLGFPGGAMALIGFASGLAKGPGYQSMTVIGASGAANTDDHQNVQLHFPGYAPRAIGTQEGLQRNAAIVQEFIDGLTSGRDLSPTLASWRQTLIVGDIVPQSIARGQAAEVGGF
jgi:predicted dehydrogenase